MGKKVYIGHSCYHSTAGSAFRLGNQANLLEKLEKNFSKVTPFELEDGQRRSWEKSYDVLEDAFRELPKQFGKLQVVFEYAMPKHKPGSRAPEDDPAVRADVILLSKNTIVVLEFKGKDPFPKMEKQAYKYKYRLQDWHVRSIGMNKKTLMVMTTLDHYEEKKRKVLDISPDKLPAQLLAIFGADFTPMSDEVFKSWLNSEWKVKNQKEN